MIELTVMVMIQNPETNEVIIQDRVNKWPGWSMPGGKVEANESFYDCAIREVKEETGLNVKNLKHCGIIHWYYKDSDNRYLVFLYKTTEFSGDLIVDSPEGRHFWWNVKELFSTPIEKFSNRYVLFFPLFFDENHSEAFISRDTVDSDWDVIFK